MARVKSKLSPLFPIAKIRAEYETTVQNIRRNHAYEQRISGSNELKDIDILDAIMRIFHTPSRYGERFYDTPLTNHVIADHLYSIDMIDNDLRNQIKHLQIRHIAMHHAL